MDAITTFRRTVERFSSRPFLFDARSELAWGEADERSDTIAAEFGRRGLQPGQAVGLCSPDSVELVLAIIGAWKAGLLPALIDARTRQHDLSYFVEDVGARVIAASSGLVDGLRQAGAKEVIDIEQLGKAGGAPDPGLHGPEAPLYLSYTTGTTGPPKGVILRSGPVTLGAACITDRLGLTRADILLATTPTSSSFQLVAALLPAIHSGATLGLLAGRTASEIWAVAKERAASVLVAYPLTLGDVVDVPDSSVAGSPFRLALSGGSPLAPRIKREYRERLGISLCESYGQSEFGGFMALGRPNESGERALSGVVGPPLPDRPAYIAGPDGLELRPGEVGEVVVPWGYFAGYANKLAEYRRTTAGGVLRCGDLGVADDDGYLKVLGRTSEREAASARGGFLREVEDVLYEHADTRHAVVVQMHNGDIAAFVEPRSGALAEAGEFSDFVGRRVAPGLRPSSTTVVQAMPRTFSGKANRLLLASAQPVG